MTSSGLYTDRPLKRADVASFSFYYYYPVFKGIALVSPQFYVKMDRSFQTVMKVYREEPPSMQWTEACGFHKE